MTEPFDVDAEPYDGIPIDEIGQEEAERASISSLRRWKENLDRGVGESGRHRGSYVNTGGARGSITQEQESKYAYRTGSTHVAVAVAERGRDPSPGNPPPFDDIMEWAHETGLVVSKTFWPKGAGSFLAFLGQLDDDQTREDVLFVWHTMWDIAENGLPAFQPGRMAHIDTSNEYEERADARIEGAIEDEQV
ncbi:hypothetical protein BRD56_05430 [Thermoplasmatales archaeon SW_10_69_26]|nr:MAG: hypothetical protein BRD56_05430 [Thermoplasmatales archaeon SW_10_69_26]